ncbi:MAG: peptidoglycan-binding protein [Defluviitaleaceae bacterium]|nr:peptidoglycan-binding protein [Defluviitaleaceae bacterium]
MKTGFLTVKTMSTDGKPIAGTKITVLGGDEVLYELATDKQGVMEKVALEAPSKEFTLDMDSDEFPYSVCNVRAEAAGYTTVTVHDVAIFDTETSILPISMPVAADEQSQNIHVPLHNLVSKEPRRMEGGTASATHQKEVVIPELITVHLGHPNTNAKKVTVPFLQYIKNCASHEIYPTWSPASLEANIYCIISFALNRIYTGWYRSRGHDFDVTNSTQFDQAYADGGHTYGAIDRMVDMIINRYLRREGHIEPHFAEYCDGRTADCQGLKQWESLALAEQGKDALQILHNFYPKDVQIVETKARTRRATPHREAASHKPAPECSCSHVLPYPGFLIRVNARGDFVAQIQRCLNAVNNAGLRVDGIFGPRTHAAVISFQRQHGLSVDGIVGPITWGHLMRLCGCGVVGAENGCGCACGVVRGYEQGHGHMPVNEAAHEHAHALVHVPEHEVTHGHTHAPAHEVMREHTHVTHMPTHENEAVHVPTHEATHGHTHAPAHMPSHESTHGHTHAPLHMPSHEATHGHAHEAMREHTHVTHMPTHEHEAIHGHTHEATHGHTHVTHMPTHEHEATHGHTHETTHEHPPRITPHPLEFVPNFPIVNNAGTEFTQKTIGNIERVDVGTFYEKAELTETEKHLNLHNLLLYLLVREMKKQ